MLNVAFYTTFCPQSCSHTTFISIATTTMADDTFSFALCPKPRIKSTCTYIYYLTYICTYSSHDPQSYTYIPTQYGKFMVIVCLLGVTTTTWDAVLSRMRGRGREAFRNIFERICEALKFFKFMVCLRLCSCRLWGVVVFNVL